MQRFILVIVIIIVSVPLFSDENDYIFVLNQSLGSELNNMGITIQNDLIKNQELSTDLLSHFDISGISRLRFHKLRKVPSQTTNLQGVTTQSMLNYDFEYFYRISIDDENVASFLEKIKSLDSFVHVQPNFRYYSMSTKADAIDEPDYDDYQETGMELMNFPDVWDIATGNGVVVAVLDTGLKIDHEEFCSGADDPDSDSDVLDTSMDYLNDCTKVVYPYDMIEEAGFSAAAGIYPIDDEDYSTRDYYPGDESSGHGTHVSGIIGAAVNDNGISGAAFGVSIMPVRVLYPFQNAAGSDIGGTGFTTDITDGIEWAVSGNADVINMSLGADGSMGEEDDYLFLTAVQDAVNAGVIVIVAAGNSSLDIDSAGAVPSSFSDTVAISSVSNTGSFASYSNYGDSIDVAAFGGELNSNGNCTDSTGVYSSYVNSTSSYTAECGTSMASPFVAALAAIIKGYYIDNHSLTLTPAEIRRLINASAYRTSSANSKYFGNGIIDAKNALFLAGENSLYNSSSSEFASGSNGLFSDLLCYPNPLDISSDSSTSCTFYLNEMADISYVIISRRGQLIAKGSQSNLSIGNQSITWNGKDRSSDSIPKGVYQLIFTATATDNETWTKKHLITVL